MNYYFFGSISHLTNKTATIISRAKCPIIFSPIITEAEFGRQILVKYFDVKFHENPSCGNPQFFPAVARTDWHDKANSLFSQLFCGWALSIKQLPAVSSNTHAARADAILPCRGVTTDCRLVLKSLIYTWRPASSVLFSHHVTLQTPARRYNKTIAWSYWTNFFLGGGVGGKEGKRPFQCFSP